MNNVINTTETVTFDATPDRGNLPDVSLATSAVLVEWNVSQWSARKKDKRASEDVAAQNGVSSKHAISVNKALIECDELKAINKFVGDVRNNFHYKETLPWSDSGLRILATELLFDYTKKMEQHMNEFNRLVEEFLVTYDWHIQKARIDLGTLFNSDEYPSASEVRKKFSFRVNYMPVPDTTDMRINVADELKSQMADMYDKFYQNQIRNIANTVWYDLYDSLKHMSERLDFFGDDKKKKLYASTVEDVQRGIRLLDKYNFTNDPKMSQLQRDLALAVDGVTVEALRVNETLRAETKNRIDLALKRCESTVNNIAQLPNLGW